MNFSAVTPKLNSLPQLWLSPIPNISRFEYLFFRHSRHLCCHYQTKGMDIYRLARAASVFLEMLLLQKKKTKIKCLCATERVKKDVPCAVLLRFKAPLRMTPIWQWSVALKRSVTQVNHFEPALNWAWGRLMIPPEWNRTVNLKAAQFCTVT